MYRRRSALALCVGAVLTVGISACADPAAPGTAAAATGSTAGATTDGSHTTAPASTSAAAPTEYGVPTTAAPAADPTDVATDAPVTPETGADVTVLITYADWNSSASVVEAAGYAGVVESGGTCTLTLSGSGGTATTTVPAEADASTTVCGGLQVPRSQLAAGTWQAVLSYASATSTGSSDPVEVTVP